MKNVLLVFPIELNDTEGFEQILCKFEENGYMVHCFDGIVATGVKLEMLLDAINYINDEYREDGINRIDVISNSKEAVLSWYRCYNSWVNDFTLFLEPSSNNFLGFNNNEGFVNQMAGFNNIQQEIIQGKVYINLNSKNYKSFISQLLVRRNYRYFKRFDEYDFQNKTVKKPIQKQYIYNNYQLIFECPSSEGEIQKNMVEIVPASITSVEFSDEMLLDIINYDRVLFSYVVLAAYFSAAGEESAHAWLVNFFYNLRGIEDETVSLICSVFFKHMEEVGTNFVEKVRFLSILSSLKGSTWNFKV